MLNLNYLEFFGCLLNQLQNKFVVGGIRRKINVFLVRINSTQGLTTLHQCTVDCTLYIVHCTTSEWKKRRGPPTCHSIHHFSYFRKRRGAGGQVKSWIAGQPLFFLYRARHSWAPLTKNLAGEKR